MKNKINSIIVSIIFILSFTSVASAGDEDKCEIDTLLTWTNTVSCTFLDISLNYVKLGAGANNRVQGTITPPSAEEDSDIKNSESQPSSTPVDPNSPINQLLDLRGSAVKGFFGLKPFFQKRILGMAAEYKNMFNQKIIVNSAYRSPAYQKVLFDRAVNKYGSVAKARHWVAPPGRSRHNSGMAIDIGMKTGMGNKIASSGLMNKYSLYRPMSYENWHFEPIESKTLRRGAGTPIELDSNISVNVGDTTQMFGYGTSSLSAKYGILELKSRYSQELNLMITELLEARNRTTDKARMEDTASEIFGIDAIGSTEHKEKMNKKEGRRKKRARKMEENDIRRRR